MTNTAASSISRPQLNKLAASQSRLESWSPSPAAILLLSGRSSGAHKQASNPPVLRSEGRIEFVFSNCDKASGGQSFFRRLEIICVPVLRPLTEVIVNVLQSRGAILGVPAVNRAGLIIRRLGPMLILTQR